MHITGSSLRFLLIKTETGKQRDASQSLLLAGFTFRVVSVRFHQRSVVTRFNLTLEPVKKRNMELPVPAHSPLSLALFLKR